MKKQEIEEAICVENLRYLLMDVLGNKNNEKEKEFATDNNVVTKKFKKST